MNIWSSLFPPLNIFWRLSKKHLRLSRDQDIVLRDVWEVIAKITCTFLKEQCRFCILKPFYSEVLTMVIIIIWQMEIKYFDQLYCNWNVSGMLNWMKAFHFESADIDSNFPFWEYWFGLLHVMAGLLLTGRIFCQATFCIMTPWIAAAVHVDNWRQLR